MLATDFMEASYGVTYPGGYRHEQALEGARARLEAAGKYVLDPRAVAMAAGVALSRPSSVLAALEFARLPCEPMWMEFSNIELRAAMASLGSPNRPTGEPGITIRKSGFLIWKEGGHLLMDYVNTVETDGKIVTDLVPIRGRFSLAGMDERARAFLPLIVGREDVPDDLAGQVRRHWASITRNPAEAAADAEIHLRFDWSRHPDMSAVRAALSAHIGEDRIQAHESAQADEMRRLFCIAVIPTLILLNCRNAVEAPETPAPEKLNRQRAKKGKPPLPAHRTIRVSLTAGAARHAGVDRAGASMDRRSPRGGLVTGHFKVRATGVYWWSPHWRGRSGDDSPDRTYVVVP